MAVEMAIWRMTDAGPHQLASSPLDLERRLEGMLAEDPGMSGTDLLIIGRQVPTSHGGYIDLLALDADGRAHVLELKRDRTPRDVVAQALDYGSWVQGLGLEDLEQIYLDHNGGETQLDEAFAARFDNPLPDVVNAEQQFTIIASELDPTSDRIVEFLAESYGVPINAVFFRHFSDDDREYLARTWLLHPQQAEDKAVRPSRRKSRPWERPRLLHSSRPSRSDRPLGDSEQVRAPQRRRRIVVLEAAAEPHAGKARVRIRGRSRLRRHRPSHRRDDPRTRCQSRGRRSAPIAARSTRAKCGRVETSGLGRPGQDRDGRAGRVARHTAHRPGRLGEGALRLTSHRLQTTRRAHNQDRRVGIRTRLDNRLIDRPQRPYSTRI